MTKIHIREKPETASLPIYMHLDPIVSGLLENGNLLARSDRWGSTKDGFVCFLQKPINFELLRELFDIPPSIILSESKNLVACEYSWATIYGDKGKWKCF